MTDQELTGQAGGVGTLTPGPSPRGRGEGGATAGGGEAGVAGGEPTAGAGPAIAEGQKVDLTQSEEFRRWQAARDRREAQLRGQLESGQRQMAEMQRQLEQVRLANADPDEVAAYYESQVAALRADQEQQAVRMQERGQIVAQAQALLDELGLSADTLGLEWGEEPSWDGLARLATSAAKVKALQAEAVAKQGTAVVTEAVQAARADALAAAGVTKVSTATGAAAPKDLQGQYEAERAKLVGTGDVGGYSKLKRKYRELGLEV